MAKKNSTKTATKEAMSASEPKVLTLAGWTGINFQNAAPGSLGTQWFDDGEADTQTSMKPKNLMIQDNVITTSDLALETRPAQIPIWELPDNEEFTGVAKLVGKHIYASVIETSESNGVTTYTENLKCKMIDGDVSFTIGNASWTISSEEYSQKAFHISDIQLVNYKGNRTLLVIDDVIGLDGEERGEYAPLRYMTVMEDGTYSPDGLTLNKKLRDPVELIDRYTVTNGNDNHPVIHVDGSDGQIVSTIVVAFCYTNEFGSTVYSKFAPYTHDSISINLTKSLQEFDYDNYLIIDGIFDVNKTHSDEPIPNGVDVYFTVNDNAYPVFAGHAEINKQTRQWSINYYGPFQDTGEWEIYNTTLPTENTTNGCRCRYARQIDGRIYFYGDKKFPERVYIGGNSGNELSCALGLGGAYIDIEPGIGTDVRAVHKFKTASGASIVTVLTTNVNTGMTQRFNIVETSVSITSSIATKTYMSEQVSNVVGTSSFHGSGVFWDGMYYIDRYGLKLTTQQMEYTSQLMSRNVSDPIKPVFTDRLASSMDNAYVLFLDGIIYISLAMNDPLDDANNIIFCYDVDAKSWYTYSLVDDGTRIPILSMIPIDYYTDADKAYSGDVDGSEGIGVVTGSTMFLIPTAGRDLGKFQLKDSDGNWIAEKTIHPFIETADVAASIPAQGWCYLRQIELNFDWFIGDLDIIVEGYDIYGRAIKCVKKISREQIVYNFQEWIMIGHRMRLWKITLKNSGDERASFRLSNMQNKVYVYSKKVGIEYGFDSLNTFRTQHGEQRNQHTSINGYNNLARYLLA